MVRKKRIQNIEKEVLRSAEYAKPDTILINIGADFAILPSTLEKELPLPRATTSYALPTWPAPYVSGNAN